MLARQLRRLGTASLLLLAACASTPPDTASQSLARRELDVMHRALLDAHPGAIDDGHPGYRERIDANYAAALARLREVRDDHDAMSLADWYAASFHDVDGWKCQWSRYPSYKGASGCHRHWR